jgi:uncharacterized protein YbjT (DUF2867 family)
MILVTGATGTAGSQVVRALLERGQPVRVLARDAERSRSLFGDAVEHARGDFADAGSLRAALAGAAVLFLSCADDPRRVEWETAAIDAAAEAGLRRIVKLSSIVAEPGSPVAFWDWHGRVERHLRASAVPAICLRSCFFMSNLLAGAAAVAHEGRLYAPAGGARIAMVDPRDVGAAAAAALAGAGREGCTYTLTGPAAVTYEDVAAELSAATGRGVEFVDVPGESALTAMIAAGLPVFAAQQVAEIFAQARHGVLAEVSADGDALTGRPPRALAGFALDHAELFAPVTAGAAR